MKKSAMNINGTKSDKNGGAIHEMTLDSWDDFTAFINLNKAGLKNCIFRGQQNTDWELIPSLYRLIHSDSRDEIIRLSNFQLELFKKNTRGRHTISYTDPNDSDETWWALGQHYGLATPLLDWVHSPYVAAYFSFSENDNKNLRSVHILDIEKIETILRQCNRNGDPINELRIIDPLMHENPRLVSQRGIFTFIVSSPKYNNFRTIEDYITTFTEKFTENIGNEILLLKIMLPSTQRETILEQLNLMNINASTLFSDLNGSAEYCNYLLECKIKENNER